MKKVKNTACFVCALIAAIFGLIGGILWSACASACAEMGADDGTLYLIGFIILGIGGSVVALIGGIQAYGFKKAGFPLVLVGLLLQVGQLILACVAVEGFSFVLNLCTIVSIILLIVAVVFARRKEPSANA